MSSSPPATSSTTARATAADIIIQTLIPEVRDRLYLLTRVADLLGIDDLSLSSYSSAITRLHARGQDAQHTLNRLELVEQELQSHLSTMVHEERLIDSWIERLGADQAMVESTSTIERRREALLKKAKEYRAMLDTIVIDPTTITFADLTTQQATNERKAQALKAKRGQIRAFRGLPPNLDLAKQQLKTARAAQMELLQLRERLLGRMAESVV
ncbi:hypothetical protein C8R44DRAFT_794304 [Mycena epipterygia]|nr:hypothetical protein C8R44DRAFT_794304 [Mycena epipterygia]